METREAGRKRGFTLAACRPCLKPSDFGQRWQQRVDVPSVRMLALRVALVALLYVLPVSTFQHSPARRARPTTDALSSLGEEV